MQDFSIVIYDLQDRYNAACDALDKCVDEGKPMASAMYWKGRVSSYVEAIQMLGGRPKRRRRPRNA